VQTTDPQFINDKSEPARVLHLENFRGDMASAVIARVDAANDIEAAFGECKCRFSHTQGRPLTARFHP